MRGLEVDAMSAASPDMTDAELAALTESIRTIGQQVPILVWHGRVIDGRKRLAACEALSVVPITTELLDERDPSAHAHALNLLRTHYTPSQRAAFAEKIANATVADGPHIRDHRGSSANSQKITIAEAGARMGANSTSIAAARRIRRNAAPEVMHAVERGALTLHAAEQIAAEVPHDKQAEAVARRVTEKTAKRNRPSKVINVAAPGRKRIPKRDTSVVRERALRTIYECADGLARFMEYDVGPADDVQQWREWIVYAIATLKTFNKKLEPQHERRA